MRTRANGFTLIEMAVVVAVIALLLGGIIVPLAAQVEERRISEMQRLLDETREALAGFAVTNGRLPCPASSTSNGVESPPGGGTCSNPHDGFVPAATLGLVPTDANGYLVDPWGSRVRYAVTTVQNTFGKTFTSNTSTAGMAAAFLAGTLTAGEAPDLRVCSTAAGASGGNCASGSTITATAPAVIFSVGPNGASGGSTGTDEIENTNNDRVFVFRPIGAGYDDVLVWLSPHVLYNRMVAAGKLP